MKYSDCFAHDLFYFSHQKMHRLLPEYVVPVPLHPKKMKIRSYNQSEYFARGLGEKNRMPLFPCIRRITHTDSQTKKDKIARWLNVSEAFKLDEKFVVKGKSLLLVDDVFTTGSTIEACAQVLINADRYTILQTLNSYREKLSEADNFLLYYAGHGTLDEKNNRGHWLPVDAHPSIATNWISNVTITDQINTFDAKHIMVIADSCYSGTLTRQVRTTLPRGKSKKREIDYYRKWAKKASRVATASIPHWRPATNATPPTTSTTVASRKTPRRCSSSCVVCSQPPA